MLGGVHVYDGDLLVQIESDDPMHGDAVARVVTSTSGLSVTIDRSFDELVCHPSGPDGVECLTAPQKIFPLAVGDFEDDGQSEVITPLAFFERSGSGWVRSTERFAFERHLSALTHDLNRDGHLDAITVGGGNGTRVDVRFGLGDGRWVLTPFATRASASHLMAGDFDGDLVDDDVAFIESSDTEDVLTVLFYDPPSFDVRRFPVLGQVESAWASAPPVGPADVAVVVAPVGDAARGYVRLKGSTSRLMLNALQPGTTSGVPVFVAVPTLSDAGPTVFAAWASGETWQWSRAAGRRFVERPVDLSGDCPTQAEQQCSSIVTEPLRRERDTEALVMVLRSDCLRSNTSTVITAQRRSADEDPTCSSRPIDAVISEPSIRMRIATADLDGTEALELVMLTGEDLRILWNYADGGDAVTSEPMKAYDVLILDADADPEPEVLVIGFGAALLYDVKGHQLELARQWPIDVPSTLTPIDVRAVAADFSGDGLTDFAIATGRTLTVHVARDSRSPE